MGHTTASSLHAENELQRLAVLIDAENAQPAVIEGLLAEVAKFGVAGVKRIYGDWTSTKHTQWKASLLEHSISPIQQFAYTTGKNSTDSALIIDAMDLMYSQRLDGSCLVSSDSDFTRLAQRLREAGKLVYGFGERKTPMPFVVACDKFIYTEVLRKDASVQAEAAATSSMPGAVPQPQVVAPVVDAAAVAGAAVAEATTSRPAGSLASPIDLISQAIEQGADDAGWAFLGAVGNYLTKIRPDFDPRLFGCRKLSDLLRKYPDRFETSERGAPGSPSKVLYARVIPRKAKAVRAG